MFTTHSGKTCLYPHTPVPSPPTPKKLRVDEKDFRLFIHRNNVIYP